jgi:DNA (cytosine-5)-methyltransferase 1
MPKPIKSKNSLYKKYVASNKLKFIDLFAGIGGFHLAFKEHGSKCVFSAEWDKFASKTYAFNYGLEPAGDITLINETSIPDHNILCAGFPCQAFSISGKMNGFNDTRGTLFFDIARIVSCKNPEILVLENVRNLVKHNSGKTLKTILRVLDDLGYSVNYTVMNASLYGVPQSRERVYFVCFKKYLKIKDYNFPKPSFESVKLADILEPDSLTKDYVIDRNDIKLEKHDNSFEFDSDLFGSAFLKPLRIGTINKGGQGERIYSIKGHAITLSAYGGGAAGKTGAYYINNKVRQLSPRECLRVQGFPDSFKFPENISVSQSYKMCGNSVSVPVITKIYYSILDKLIESEISINSNVYKSTGSYSSGVKNC